MRPFYWFLACLIVSLGLWEGISLGETKPASKEQPDIKAAQKAEAIVNLAKISSLIEFGRGEMAEQTGLKKYKSPEALVAAAGILLRAEYAFGGKTVPLGTEPTDLNGKPIKTEDAKFPGLSAEAEALFDEARTIAIEQKAKLSDLELLIKEAKAISKNTQEERGALGFPRAIYKNLPAKENHTYKIPFAPGVTAAISLRSSDSTNLRLEIIAETGERMFNRRGSSVSHEWTTAASKKARMITINVYNITNKPTSYQLITN